MNEAIGSAAGLAERTLLSAIFADPGNIWEVRQTVRVGDFESPQAAVVYEAMCDAADGGQLPSPLTVADALKTAANSAALTAYAMGLLDADVNAYQSVEASQIVAKLGRARRLSEVGAAIAEDAASNPDGAVQRAAALLAGVQDDELVASRPIGAAFDELLDEMATTLPYTATPWPSLNAMIGGVRPGCMYTVAAASGGGKSVFGLQLAAHIAESSGRVGYVSLEMDEKVILRRLLSMMLGIHVTALNNHQLSEEGWATVRAARTAVSTFKLEVFDRAQATLSDVQGFARSLARKGDLKMLVIDYLGLMESPPGSRASDRSAILNGYANALKRLAGELGITVVVLEQLNRDSAARKSSRPVISDIRGTAALEHAADAVVLLHREKRMVAGREVMGKNIDFILAKNRQGESGSRTLYFDGKHSRILQSEYESTPLLGQEEV